MYDIKSYLLEFGSINNMNNNLNLVLLFKNIIRNEYGILHV